MLLIEKPLHTLPIALFLHFDSWIDYLQRVIEPPHDKTNKMTCVPSKDSDRPVHPPSLIRVLAFRMKNLGSLTTY